MASINWLKMSTQKAGAMIKHNGEEERIAVNHSNTDIDKSLSYKNFNVGCSGYEDAYKKLKKRIKEVDEENPPLRVKKDRITSISLYATLPKEIAEQGDEAICRFFEGIHKIYEDFFGKENVMGTCVHLDEQHSYIDHGDKRMSLIHSHTLVASYAEWSDKDGNPRAGINGKNCSTKARIKALNNAVDSWVYYTYGFHYNTGKEARNLSVEQLKLQSLREEHAILKQNIQQLQQERIEASYKPQKSVFKKRDEESTVTILTGEYERLVACKEQIDTIKEREQKLDIKERNLSSWAKALEEGINNHRETKMAARMDIENEVKQKYEEQIHIHTDRYNRLRNKVINIAKRESAKGNTSLLKILLDVIEEIEQA